MKPQKKNNPERQAFIEDVLETASAALIVLTIIVFTVLGFTHWIKYFIQYDNEYNAPYGSNFSTIQQK